MAPGGVTAVAALPTAADLPALSLPAAAAAAAAVAAAVSLSDPERRRRAQAEAAGGGDKEAVRAYFNSTGFERWRKIYGSATEGVNRVQLDIREGHAQTVAAALSMLRDSPLDLAGATVCDAGCGTGSLSIPLAAEGADVLASDISAAMVSEAQRQAPTSMPSGTSRTPSVTLGGASTSEGSSPPSSTSPSSSRPSPLAPRRSMREYVLVTQIVDREWRRHRSVCTCRFFLLLFELVDYRRLKKSLRIISVHIALWIDDTRL
ncbi:hypothetical protein HU200_015093 [Digitaria exilis]|uniref:Methyltransferase domain-containing protein n=1 Tax=Digitaria exilis TaxID=1010633 RepID=A0A835F9T3_9POAL|nr:hypothetical protein HU200_015093 [Digitaria exilis]